MPSKKRITRVRFNDVSHSAIPISSTATSSSAANQATNSVNAIRAPNHPAAPPSATRTTNPQTILTPTSPALSSNPSTPLTPSPQVSILDHIIGKIFSKSLIASLTRNDALLKEVRDCILNNNESRSKALNAYIHSYWKDLHVRSGCVCIDEKVAIPNVLREALFEDIHASHPGTREMIFMAAHCWWPYMNREIIVKATECKPCTANGKNLKLVIPAKQFKAHIPNQELQIDFGDLSLTKKVMKYTS